MVDTHKGDQSHSSGNKNVGNAPGNQSADPAHRRESGREHADEQRQHATQHGKGKEERKHT
ncbi:MAG TPA: hypothetical protein VFJ96_04480 [Gemmatimonadaceae bacterium]|jgi:hypothetical protein|nr:hypothetical protein [Gemmatimonadaceae bacterium]